MYKMTTSDRQGSASKVLHMLTAQEYLQQQKKKYCCTKGGNGIRWTAKV